MEKQVYYFLGNMVVSLLEVDHFNTYVCLVEALNISKRSVSQAKKGEDIRIHYYIAIINYAMGQIGLRISMERLERLLRQVLREHRNLVIGTVPYHAHVDAAPEQWMVVIQWE